MKYEPIIERRFFSEQNWEEITKDQYIVDLEDACADQQYIDNLRAGFGWEDIEDEYGSAEYRFVGWDYR